MAGMRSYPLATFFALAYAISWLLWAPLWLPAFGVDGLPTLPFHHALGALGPIAAAFLVSAAETGVAGPVDLVRRMGLCRSREFPYLSALGFFAYNVVSFGYGEEVGWRGAEASHGHAEPPVVIRAMMASAGER